MDVERNIALGKSCDVDQRLLVDSMPLLDAQRIARFLSFGSDMQLHHTVAQRVVDNRYTYYGWKDYMYCYINSSDTAIDDVIDAICSYSCMSSTNHVTAMLMFFRLLYSPTMLVTIDASSKYVWRYFNNRMWMHVDKLQIKGMLYARVRSSNITSRMLIPSSKLEGVMESVYSRLMRGDINSYMFSSGFDETSDNKETTFCMSSCTYDIANGCIRRPLPGDMCTLAGDVDPDTMSWQDNRSEMMQILSKWMGGDDVASSYLDILSGALSEFGPRYAVINSGTGADGKSTFFHIVSKLFGSYCMTTPGSGPSVDTKGSNDATPVATAMVSKRVYVTTDANNVWRLLTSPGFKSVTGGDQSYIRRLYREASSNSPRLKALVLINTNQTDFVATSINELTRIRIVKWSSKRITDEDRDIIPKHQSIDSHSVIHKYENVFIGAYGSCMMMELIGRHIRLMRNNMIVDVCPKIRQWTRDMVAPRTIVRFMHACTQQCDTTNAQELDEATAYALSVQPKQDDVPVERLFMAYVSWRKTGARFSNTDPVTMEAFKTHLEFYYPIHRRIAQDGAEELYVKGVTLKPDMDFLTMLYPSSRGAPDLLQSFSDVSINSHGSVPSIVYTSLSSQPQAIPNNW